MGTCLEVKISKNHKSENFNKKLLTSSPWKYLLLDKEGGDQKDEEKIGKLLDVQRHDFKGWIPMKKLNLT